MYYGLGVIVCSIEPCPQSPTGTPYSWNPLIYAAYLSRDDSGVTCASECMSRADCWGYITADTAPVTCILFAQPTSTLAQLEINVKSGIDGKSMLQIQRSANKNIN